MFNKIKEKLNTAWNWVKRKAKEVVIVLGIVGVVLAAGSQVIPDQSIPEDLLLKCDKADILETYQRGDNIEYAYKTNIKILKLDNEVKRTNTTLTRLERDRFYRVKEGDSLDKISKELNVDKKTIKGYKSKNPDIIYPDEVIDLGSKQYSVESGHSQYFDGEDWYEVKFATTTIEMFNKQMISLVERVFAVDTGWKSPTTNAERWSQWTNPANAYSSNDQYATVSTEALQRHSYGTFGFGIGSGDIIDGVEISVEHHENGQSMRVSWYCTSDASESTTSELPERGSDTTDTVGGAADLWGRTPIGSDFSDTDFSATIHGYGEAGSVNFYLDHIQVKVYYTEAAAERRIIIIE